LVAKNQFMTLPLQGLSIEHRERILANVENAKRAGA
jgi:hypothetical protein